MAIISFILLKLRSSLPTQLSGSQLPPQQFHLDIIPSSINVTRLSLPSGGNGGLGVDIRDRGVGGGGVVFLEGGGHGCSVLV